MFIRFQGSDNTLGQVTRTSSCPESKKNQDGFQNGVKMAAITYSLNHIIDLNTKMKCLEILISELWSFIGDSGHV